MVSRSQAKAIAEEHLSERGQPTRIRAVYSLPERPFGRPILYGIPLEACWIAYVEQPEVALRSSFVVAVSKDSGAVLYCGSANDEG